MAALMTSVIDNSTKVAEYVMACRQMGIDILPPDVNEGEYGFSVSGNAIRYGLSAIKSLGRPVIEALVNERSENGKFKNLRDFIERMGKEANKRTIENFIKSGAFDCFEGNRRQQMLVYSQIVDDVARNEKNSLTGQMSLFDFVDEETKAEFEIKMPDVPEYGKKELLAFEKEVLGIYVSGHPLDEYTGMVKKYVTNVTTDFEIDDETGETKVRDGNTATIGGMIMNKSVKTTKNGQLMAYLTIEDLVGTVEVIVFPRNFLINRPVIDTADKVFVTGRVQANADENARLICDKVIDFNTIPRKLWIRFESEEEYQSKQSELNDILYNSDGKDSVIIYCTKENKRIALPASRTVQVNSELLMKLKGLYGDKNVTTT